MKKRLGFLISAVFTLCLFALPAYANTTPQYMYPPDYLEEVAQAPSVG